MSRYPAATNQPASLNIWCSVVANLLAALKLADNQQYLLVTGMRNNSSAGSSTAFAGPAPRGNS